MPSISSISAQNPTPQPHNLPCSSLSTKKKVALVGLLFFTTGAFLLVGEIPHFDLLSALPGIGLSGLGGSLIIGTALASLIQKKSSNLALFEEKNDTEAVTKLSQQIRSSIKKENLQKKKDQLLQKRSYQELNLWLESLRDSIVKKPCELAQAFETRRSQLKSLAQRYEDDIAQIESLPLERIRREQGIMAISEKSTPFYQALKAEAEHLLDKHPDQFNAWLDRQKNRFVTPLLMQRKVLKDEICKLNDFARQNEEWLNASNQFEQEWLQEARARFVMEID